MTVRRTAARLAGLVLAALACGHGGRTAAAGWYGDEEEEEIAPLRLTRVDGHAQLRYLTDATTSSGGGAAASASRQSILLEEVFLMTHGYIYHPTLLAFDFGGGPVFEQERDTQDGSAVPHRRRRLFNLQARAAVLRDKPYSGALYFDRSNQTRNLGPAVEVLTVNTRKGVDLALREPVTPLPVRLELTRTTTHGEGAQQVVDDRVDQLRFTSDAAIGTLGTSSFQYTGTRQRSLSGSATLPIQESTFRDEAALLDTRLKFGAQTRYELTNTISIDRNRYRIADGGSNRLDNTTVLFDLRGQPSDELQTIARYQYSRVRQVEDESTLNAASASATYRFTPGLTGSAGLRAETTRGNRLDATLYVADGSALYEQPLWGGQASIGYTFAYARRDQQALAADARVTGEHVTLTGTRFVTLGRPQPVAASVVVSNLARTQVFVEGVDYVLVALGLNLRIQRLVGGGILEGQEVLVDYAFLTGGTFALTQRDQSVSVNWGWRNIVNLYTRWLDVAPHLSSGTPTAPLNPVRSVVWGARSDVPVSGFGQALTLGGSVERERRHEEILPYRRASDEVYGEVQLPVVASGTLRLAGRRLRIDYDNAPEQGVRLRGRDLRLFAQVGFGVDVSLDATRERDTGQPIVRERSLTSARAQWRRRMLSLSIALTRAVDVQGSSERRRTYGQLTLRRDL